MSNWFALGCPEMKILQEVCISYNPYQYVWIVEGGCGICGASIIIVDSDSLNESLLQNTSTLRWCLWHSFFEDCINLSQHFMLEWVLHLINGAVWFANGLIMFLTNRCNHATASYSWMSHLRPGWKPKCTQIISQEPTDRLQWLHVCWWWVKVTHVEEGSNHRRFKHIARLQCLQICCSAEFMIAGTSKWIEYCIALIAW